MMKGFIPAAALLLSVSAIAQTVTQTCSNSSGTLTTTFAPTAVVAPSPAPANVAWVFHNGLFNWAGDYSWNATINYQDGAGGPMLGNYDIAVTIVAPYGGFQPFAQNKSFDSSQYKYLNYCAKPTRNGQVFGTGFAAINDVRDGNAVNIGIGGSSAYGPAPVAGVWGCYHIPLADFQFTNPIIQKFTVADGSGATSNVYYVDEVGFSN